MKTGYLESFRLFGTYFKDIVPLRRKDRYREKFIPVVGYAQCTKCNDIGGTLVVIGKDKDGQKIYKHIGC
jgi:hypothetical protein